MRLSPSACLSAVAFGLALAAGPALAQTPLALPPPGGGLAPPSAGAAAPTAARPRKPARRAKKSDGSAAPAAAKRAADPTFSDTATTKPRRFVPEEFDNDDANSGSPRPYMSPSGRPGVGMRF